VPLTPPAPLDAFVPLEELAVAVTPPPFEVVPAPAPPAPLEPVPAVVPLVRKGFVAPALQPTR
jgi:hypothetical protein